ncbi:hypothetical protein D3C76_421170 [compost metagenome]
MARLIGEQGDVAPLKVAHKRVDTNVDNPQLQDGREGDHLIVELDHFMDDAVDQVLRTNEWYGYFPRHYLLPHPGLE